MKSDKLLRLDFPLPPLSEQQRIAAILHDQLAAVERARAGAEARLKAAKALPGAYVSSIFDSPEAEAWPAQPLIDICQSGGQYGTSARSNGQGAGLPVLGMFHIHEGGIRWKNVNHVELNERDQAKYLLSRGDLLFNRTNSAELVGKTAVYDLDRPALFASYLIRFRINKYVADPRFVSLFINSPNGQRFIEKRMARAIGQVNISATTMHQMPVPTPDIAVQQRSCDWLAGKMRSVDSLRSLLLGELETFNSFPAGLLRRAFNGEL